MFVKLGITGKESSAFSGFAFPFGEGKRGGPRFKFNFYFLGGDHFKYLYLCGGTPKIIKILVVVPQIIDGVPTPARYFFLEKPLHHMLPIVFYHPQKYRLINYTMDMMSIMLQLKFTIK
jgi:hypothetical protein